MASFLAHKKEDGNQLLIDHLNNTAELCKKFASKFGAEKFGYILGLYHDIGKYSEAFQRRINGEDKFVDHSTAGAIEVAKAIDNAIGQMLAYCIMGHHSGLADFGDDSISGSYCNRLTKFTEDYSNYKKEVIAPIVPPKMPISPERQNLAFQLQFFTRMLFSCLKDADILDTVEFLFGQAERPFCLNHDHILETINKKTQAFLQNKKTPVNEVRSAILQHCISAGNQEKGIYSLLIPTGSGKTFSSLAFAAHHASKHKMDRIIYVIPYLSIIEQTAGMLKELFGEDCVLEHHSNVISNENDMLENEKGHIKVLASENWNVPIIVTTNIQFFESMFDNKTSKTRKLHNVANSVVILDEAQMMPVKFQKPFLHALQELARNYKSTILLTTATLPKFDIELKNIISLDATQRKVFDRVECHEIGQATDEQIAELAQQQKQILLIVNTRKHAKELFGAIKGENKFHLSTLMTPLHRKEVLMQVRKRLNEGKPCTVVSTQLIEAGVDIDFPVVARSLAGIDSLVQSAGRCNREGKMDKGAFYVFEALSASDVNRGEIFNNQILAKGIEGKISDEALDCYYAQQQALRADEHDGNKLLEMFRYSSQTGKFQGNFSQCAEACKIIETKMVDVVIQSCEETKSLLRQLEFSSSAKIKRKLQKYAVSIYEHELKKLRENGIVEYINDCWVLSDMDFYDSKTGLKLQFEEKTLLYV